MVIRIPVPPDGDHLESETIPTDQRVTPAKGKNGTEGQVRLSRQTPLRSMKPLSTIPSLPPRRSVSFLFFFLHPHPPLPNSPPSIIPIIPTSLYSLARVSPLHPRRRLSGRISTRPPEGQSPFHARPVRTRKLLPPGREAHPFLRNKNRYCTTIHIPASLFFPSGFIDRCLPSPRALTAAFCTASHTLKSFTNTRCRATGSMAIHHTR
jgi:hypothetical protein